jgi:hypothetical protein
VHIEYSLEAEPWGCFGVVFNYVAGQMRFFFEIKLLAYFLHAGTERFYKRTNFLRFKAQWLTGVPPGVTSTNATFCPHYLCVSQGWVGGWVGGTASISLYSVNSLVFITDMVCVYCAVRTEPVTKFEAVLCL